MTPWKRLASRDRLDVALEGRYHLGALVVVEAAQTGAVAEPAVEALGLGDLVEQRDAGAQLRELEHLVDGAFGGVEPEREAAVVGGLGEEPHLVEVGAGVGAHERA